MEETGFSKHAHITWFHLSTGRSPSNLEATSFFLQITMEKCFTQKGDFSDIVTTHNSVTCITHNFLMSSHYNEGVHLWTVPDRLRVLDAVTLLDIGVVSGRVTMLNLHCTDQA